MTDEPDEGRHPPGADPDWEESFAFDFADRDGSVGGYARLGLRPADGVAWYWAAFVARDGALPSLVVVRDHEVPLPPGRSLEVRASGLWADHTCESSLEHWTVGVEAFGVSLDDPAEAFGRERGDPCPLGFDLEWESAGPPRATALGSGYELPCVVHGEVLVGSGRIELDGIGWRTHRWGRWDWWAGSGWAWAAGHRPDGEVFATAEVVVDAAEGLVESARVAGGLTATPLAHAPVSIPGSGNARSRLDRALCRYSSLDGPVAVGWVERLTPPAPT